MVRVFPDILVIKPKVKIQATTMDIILYYFTFAGIKSLLLASCFLSVLLFDFGPIITLVAMDSLVFDVIKGLYMQSNPHLATLPEWKKLLILSFGLLGIVQIYMYIFARETQSILAPVYAAVSLIDMLVLCNDFFITVYPLLGAVASVIIKSQTSLAFSIHDYMKLTGYFTVFRFMFLYFRRSLSWYKNQIQTCPHIYEEAPPPYHHIDLSTIEVY